MKRITLAAIVVTLVCLTLQAVPCSALQVPSSSSAEVTNASEKKFQKSLDEIKTHDDLIIEAFKETHDGWSSDEVVLQDGLNKNFLKACAKKLVTVGITKADPAALNWRLVALRKAGKLKVKSTKRASSTAKATPDLKPQTASEISTLAEIAMRSVQDESKVSSDRIMTDPILRSQFDAVVTKLNPKADLYSTRKAAFKLRKTRHLQPELITRLADWGRQVKTYGIDDLRKSVDSVDAHPGIYIFRDQTGYLYIGQTENLRKRMAEHLEESHNPSLASYLKSETGATVELHSFDPKSRAKEVRVRRAYESELIRSRKPRFNVLP